MNESHDSDSVRENSPVPGPLSSFVEQFEDAWRKASADSEPPNLESFVQNVDPKHRRALRVLLEPINEKYRQRRKSSPSAHLVEGEESGVRAPKTETGAAEPTMMSQQSRQTPGSLEDSFDVDADIDVSPDVKLEATFIPKGETADTATTPPKESAEQSTDPRTAVTANWQPGDKEDEGTAKGAGSRRGARPAIPGYDIIGSLGRGGMGVVYKARQKGLNRLVALKMILSGGHASLEQLARFKAEAEAVGQLQHANIVQIHEIGWQDGLPYFSLEFVDGISLEEERDGQPMSAARAADLVETLSRAIHYAHQQGIVHRDLKPANVLLTREGVPKISDFGLVKRIEDDASQTKTGTIMGTPSYMAPEQAWGAKDIGPSVDIYALGSVLYALLTGRPPFLGPTPLETVMQLRHQEPVPPTRLQPKIPRDVETICLKCLQKDAAKRYGTAEELAEDLRRFQAGEPIQARPVGRLERTWRWCRRNPSLAISGAVAAALAFCLMIGGPVAAIMIYEQKELAEEQKQLAQSNEQKAVQAETEARVSEKKAVVNAQIAAEQRDLAVESLNLVAEKVNDQLHDRPQMQELRQQLLVMVLERLNRVADTAGGTQNKNLVMARAHRKLGDLMLEVGEARTALDQYQRCHSISLAMAEEGNSEKPHVPKLNLGRSYVRLGEAEARLKQPDVAKQHYLKSLQMRLEALPLAPDKLFCKQEIADSYGHLGEISLTLGELTEAEKYYRESLKLRGEWADQASDNIGAVRELAGAYMSVGHAFRDSGALRPAIEHYKQSLELLHRVEETNPDSVRDRGNVALVYSHLGTVHLFANQPDRAKDDFTQAVTLLDELSQQDPENAKLKEHLAGAWYGLAAAQLALGEAEANQGFDRCLKIRRELVRTQPDDRQFQTGLLLALARCRLSDEAVQLADDLLTAGSNDTGLLYQVACSYALCAPVIAADEDRSPEERRTLAEEYANKAVQLLRRAIAQGYQGRAMLRIDPDLEPLRERPDFRELLELSKSDARSNKAD